MHQKQPPAKTAVRVADGVGSARTECVTTKVANNEANFRIPVRQYIYRNVRFVTFLRMRDRAHLHQNEATIEFVPASIVDQLNLREIFRRDAPVEIDLGCGNGMFLAAIARQNPDRNFLGIERLLGRVRSVCRKIARLNLENVRVIRMESSYAVAHLLPPSAISAFHVLFPDPWPKRRHHRRRLFTAEFFGAMDRALEWNGLLHLATDDADYFRSIYKMIAIKPSFSVSEEEAIEFPMTAFEQKLAVNGAPIQRLLLRKVSPVR